MTGIEPVWHRQAVAHGYANRTQIKRDPAYRGLRDRQDFVDLLLPPRP